MADEVRRFPNLMVVKSMSKDFGVAGIRAGYAVMAPERVRTLLDNGYLWNSSGLAEYFFDLYSRPDFQERYERERIRFIRNSRRFFAALAKTEGLRVYPTQANFALVELQNGLERRGPGLAAARPPRDLHPDLRRQAGPRARQVPADRRPQPPRERLHHPLPPPPDRLSIRTAETTKGFRHSDGRNLNHEITRISTDKEPTDAGMLRYVASPGSVLSGGDPVLVRFSWKSVSIRG